VTVECIGEVTDVTWFAGTDVIKVLPPRGRVANLGSGGSAPEGTPIALAWDDPIDFTPTSYSVWGSIDGGGTWSELGTALTTHDFAWTPVGDPLGEVILEVVAFEGEHPVGAWQSEPIAIDAPTTGVGDGPVAAAFDLRFAGRNPSVHGASLQLAMPASGRATVQVYDVRGALVKELVDGEIPAGYTTLRWDGRDRNGSEAGAGLYFIHASRGSEAAIVRRFTLLR
jgi:hypothetical protein